MMAEYVTKEAFEKFKAEDFAQVQQDLTVLTVKADNLDDKLNTLFALMLDLRTDFSLPCKLIAEEHFLYDSIFTRI